MIRGLFARTTCRHSSGCTTPTGADDLMCPAHADDETLPTRDGDRLAPWDLNRRATWPTNRDRRNG